MDKFLKKLEALDFGIEKQGITGVVISSIYEYEIEDLIDTLEIIQKAFDTYMKDCSDLTIQIADRPANCFLLQWNVDEED